MSEMSSATEVKSNADLASAVLAELGDVVPAPAPAPSKPPSIIVPKKTDNLGVKKADLESLLATLTCLAQLDDEDYEPEGATLGDKLRSALESVDAMEIPERLSLVETIQTELKALKKKFVEMEEMKKELEEYRKKDADKSAKRKARREARKAGGGGGEGATEGGGGRKSRAKKTALTEEEVRRIAKEEAQKVNGGSVATPEEESESESEE